MSVLKVTQNITITEKKNKQIKIKKSRIYIQQMYKVLKKKKKLINFIQLRFNKEICLINKEIKKTKRDNKNIKGGLFAVNEKR